MWYHKRNMSNNMLSANSQNIKKFQLQQKGKNVLIVVLIVAPLFIGGIIYVVYTQLTNEATTSQTDPGVIPTETGFDKFSGEAPDGAIVDDPANFSSPAQNSSGGGSSSPSTNPGITPSGPSGGSGSSASTPAGVLSAANSIEATGIKGNPYVASNVNTSNLPAGSTIRFDKNSWSQFSANSGTLNATVTISGTDYAGSVTFKSTGGSWKATGYGI